MRRAFVSLLSFALILQTFTAFAALPLLQTPASILFGPVSDISKMPIVKKIPYLTQASTVERGKIEFLIARVRKSKLIFVRNGEMYQGRQAAMLLSHKYRKRMENVKSVQQFIDEVASGSTTTGEPYYVKETKEGAAYRVRDIFLNELRELEQYLSKQPSPQPFA
jgi:hypothetical protein